MDLVASFIIAGLLFLAWMAIILANKSFSLITVLPEVVVGWFGGHWRGTMGGFDDQSKGAILAAMTTVQRGMGPRQRGNPNRPGNTTPTQKKE
jgi:hypothetical protein